MNGIGSAFQKIGQDAVGIRGTDQFLYGETDLLRQPAGKDVAEVSGRNDKENLFARGNLLLFQKILIGRKVINDLRYESSDVNRVCRAQAYA